MKEITPNIKIVKSKDINADPRTFIDGSARSTADLFSMKIGRGVYNPGWKWSIHTGPQTGKTSVKHRGSLISWILPNRNSRKGKRTKMSLLARCLETKLFLFYRYLSAGTSL